MRPTFSVSAAWRGRRRATWLIPFLGAMIALPTAAAASTTPAASTTLARSTAAAAPAVAGNRVLATFSGKVRGIVLLSELEGGGLRVTVTVVGAPRGRVRLVGSTADCSTPSSSADRVFSLGYPAIAWVRDTVPGLLEEEGIWYLRSVRLIKPGSLARQLACRPARYLQPASAPTVAYELSNTMITSFIVAGGVRGMIVTGPGFLDPVPLHAVIQRRQPGITYRLVGSTAPCGTTHQASETVFDRAFPTSGAITAGITSMDDWEAGVSLRIFRGAGFSKLVGCIQDGILELEEIF